MADAALRGVSLEREVELAAITLQVRDLPGRGGPLVHLPDPFLASPHLPASLVELAPNYRLLSLAPRQPGAFQGDAWTC
ncbi:MAG: hypothetical protein M3336_11435 [Chloroflexota bacterium]|nr:hypothetical protein [Chloroflexota bacterium]